MPILARECDCLPATLLTGDTGSDGRQWWLARTLPRQEKALARDLVSRDVPFYLPCQPRRVRIRQRVVTSQSPLFPGYVFVRLTEADRLTIYATRRVLQLMPVADQERCFADLRQVWRLLDLGRPVERTEAPDPGTLVRVRSGPLAGLVGTMIRAATGGMFVIRVELMQQGMAVAVEPETLGRLD